MPADGENIKKRQPATAAQTTESGGGYTSGYNTDESNDAVDNKRSRDKRRAGRRPKAGVEGDKEGSNGKASLLWLVLSIGLLFCLMDAAYISRVLDKPMQKIVIAGKNGGRSVLQASPVQGVSQEDAKGNSDPQQVRLSGSTVSRRRRTLSPEKKAQREEEKKKAEEERIEKIKMAALEALRAENGGKLAEDIEAKYLENNEAFKPRPMSEYRERAMIDDKLKILDLFIEAGLKEMDDSTYAVLPTWSEVTKLYGNEPRILGLDQCEAFQNKGDPWEHFVSTAGTFNSGTNLMAEMLIHNCHMQARMDKLGFKNRGIRWQVPWGKHTPPGDEEYRLNHKSTKDQGVDATMILPAVTVRDPYYWMQSMCKHHYTASWKGSDRCPNLIPSELDKENYPTLTGKDYFPLRVRYADFVRSHESLTGLWNDWYNEYKGVEFHRLFVRYEDLLFHPKLVTETVCKCAGGVMNGDKFSYVVDSAKKGLGAHGSVRTGYIDAIIKYGSERHRYNGYHPEDLIYAREHLDPALMEDFGYKYHPKELEEHNEKRDHGGNAGNEHEDEEEGAEQRNEDEKGEQAEENGDKGDYAGDDKDNEDAGDAGEEPSKRR